MTGFQYQGLVTDITTAGAVSAMRLAVATATITDMDVRTSCQSGSAVHMTLPSGGVATATTLTLDVTFVSGTVGGTGFAFSVAAPPPPGVLLGGSATVVGPSADATAMSAASLRGPLSEAIVACP